MSHNTYNKRPFPDTPTAAKIIDIIPENDSINTYILDISVGGKPGQFINLWIPGVNEKPFSIAFDDGKFLHLLIATVGPFTEMLAKQKIGDKVGIRGPYGKTFHCNPKEHLALVAGGYGVAPLYFLAHNAVKDNCSVDFILGARTKDLICYENKITKLKNTTLHIATNDGSKGYHGFNTDILKKIVTEKKIDGIKTVGPELMMNVISSIASENNIAAEISVERYMKCGFGVCGNCCTDGTGAPSCTEGPVMSNEIVRTLKDFGKYHRDSTGEKIML